MVTMTWVTLVGCIAAALVAGWLVGIWQFVGALHSMLVEIGMKDDVIDAYWEAKRRK